MWWWEHDAVGMLLVKVGGKMVADTYGTENQLEGAKDLSRSWSRVQAPVEWTRSEHIYVLV